MSTVYKIDDMGYEIAVYYCCDEFGNDYEYCEYADPYWEEYESEPEPDEAWDIMYEFSCRECGSFIEETICQECYTNQQSTEQS